MVSNELLEVLRCPESRQRLQPASPQILERLNAAISTGQLRNRGGDTIEKTLEAGLVRDDGTLLYPVVDGIPVMLVDEAIVLDASA